MVTCFVDTWFLIAIFDRYDSHHRRALDIGRRVERARLITHDGVLTEFLAFVAGSDPQDRAGAIRLVRNTLSTYVVVPAGRALFSRGIDLYASRLDKHYSLTDCISMLVMRDNGITHVITNDHHFRQEGFTVVSE